MRKLNQDNRIVSIQFYLVHINVYLHWEEKESTALATSKSRLPQTTNEMKRKQKAKRENGRILICARILMTKSLAIT